MCTLTPVITGRGKDRYEVSRGKQAMLDAIVEVVHSRRAYWPMTLRAVHYKLLDDPPPLNTTRRDSAGRLYANDQRSYSNLSDMLTRARLEGLVPWGAVTDEQRPPVIWDVVPDLSGFVERERSEFLRGYSRDLLQTQGVHVEVVTEKATVMSIIRPVVSEFCIPVIPSKGYSSITVRNDMADRFDQSGKARLILLFVTDFDPEGMNIPENYMESLRDDFGIGGRFIQADGYRVALNREQIDEYGLPEDFSQKTNGTRYAGFVEQYGPKVCELDALEPETLQTILRDAITDVLDMAAFRAEQDAEREERERLEELRDTVDAVLDEAIGGAS